MSDSTPFVVEADDGDMIRSPLAGPMLVKARAERTGGQFTLLENEVPPKAGPALHRHGNEDEMYYVLEGTFQQSEFAADITAVRNGDATREYQDASAFFQRTYITEGMRLLLIQMAQLLDQALAAQAIECAQLLAEPGPLLQ